MYKVIISDRLGIDADDIRVVTGDTDLGALWMGNLLVALRSARQRRGGGRLRQGDQ